MLDAFQFMLNPNRALGAKTELIEEHAYDEWREEDDGDDDGLQIIDADEFGQRFLSDFDPDDTEPRATNGLPTPTKAQIAWLKTQGYRIEDMGAKFGPGWWDGEYRWINPTRRDFQDHDTSDTEINAWAEAMNNQLDHGCMPGQI